MRNRGTLEPAIGKEAEPDGTAFAKYPFASVYFCRQIRGCCCTAYPPELNGSRGSVNSGALTGLDIFQKSIAGKSDHDTGIASA
jgi:hypothetical protein